MSVRARGVRTRQALVALLLAVGGLSTAGALEGQGKIISPETFFGFQLGGDRKIARWDRMVEYYRLLEREGGGKLKVVEMGPTTQGNPFLLVVVSSPANMARLERLRQVNASLSDPRGLAEAEVRKLVAEGRVVVCQSMSLHATEIGGTQVAPELAFELVTRGDDETRRILDNVVLLLVPCFNPDGQIMVADWYHKTLGTESEGVSPPWLYHPYAGHDNNRDAFQGNLVESRYMAKILFRDWVPQAYVDHHHMGSYGARIYIPPYAEPIRPWGDPLVWREMSWYGGHMAYKEEEAGLSGVLNMAQYSGWGHFGFHWITPFHNIAGMLTESASARIATPLFIHPDQLRGGTRGLPAYELQTTFPNPWPGGWWRLRDIMDRQKVSAWALLDLAARNRETVLWNAHLKARRQTERGAQGRPLAYVIPASQHDPLTAAKLVGKLLAQGIEVLRSPKAFGSAHGMSYGPGAYLVPLAQPKMGLIRYLLGRTSYPDNEWTRAKDGSPMRPYDMATDTMFEFMGVRVDPLDEPVRGDPVKVTAVVSVGKVAEGRGTLAFDGRLNDSFRALNRLLDAGVAVRRAGKAVRGLRAGDFVVGPGSEAHLAAIAKETGVDFTAAPADSQSATREVRRLRLGLYQRYWGGNMDEGWTRLLLEQFGFPYATLMDAEIRKGDLNQKHDLILIPDDSTSRIVGEEPEAAGRSAEGRDEGGRPRETYPPEYRSGIGAEGVAALKAFVQKGGTLVTLGGASQFAIDKLGLSLRNAVAGRSSKEFWCPGSTLRARFEPSHPLAWGMPSEGLLLYLGGNPAFEVVPGDHNERYEVAARFADRDLLESGWLVGEAALAKKAAVVSAAYDEGRVILYGIRPQHRAQTHGTFKLLFNALVR
jgi:hypothetical protein